MRHLTTGEYGVCDRNLQVIEIWDSLHLAKKRATSYASDFLGHIFFVCDCRGEIWGGFSNCHIPKDTSGRFAHMVD